MLSKFTLSLSICLLAVSVLADPPQLETLPYWSTSELNVTTTGMIWRDVNLDGYVDAVFGNGNDITQSPNMIYLSRDGVMPGEADWYSSNHEFSGHVAVGDIDDDGYPDVVVANFLGTSFDVPNVSDLYMNLGGIPETSPSWQTPDSMFAFSCALGDIDLDGDLDVLFANGYGYFGGDYRPDVMYTNNNGIFTNFATWATAENTAALDVALGDVDNDGDLDAAFCYDNRATSLYENQNGVLNTVPIWQSDVVQSGNTLMFADINGDGWLDLVVAYNNQLGGTGRYVVYFNNGSGALQTPAGWMSASGGYGSALATYDYDHDGDLDLATGRWFTRIFVYENTGSTLSLVPVWQSANTMVAEEMAWIDVDGTGTEYISDTLSGDGFRKLFYVEQTPLQEVDSVVVDGVRLDYPEFCYDPFHGWVSVGTAPSFDIEIYYQYSTNCDLTVSNWDTVSMAFANQAKPLVDFYAEPNFGFAPLEVTFTDSSEGASDWDWSIDGFPAASGVSTFDRTFDEAGFYDVFLETELPDGYHNGARKSMVTVLADTLYVGGMAVKTSGNITMPVVLANTQSLSKIVIPVKYAGGLNLTYDGYDLVGCRTDYFEQIRLAAFNPMTKEIVLELRPKSDGTGVPLAPGRGAVINLNFIKSGFGSAPVDTTSLSGYELSLVGQRFEYEPRVVAWPIYHGECGNLDGSIDGVCDIGDLTELINYLFLTFIPPDNFEMANVDGSSDWVVDIGDLNYLINYLFLLGDAPFCPWEV